ncbi:ABC transporter permease [Arthrobacter sp. TB 23]|uniref:ABC transporter permease n=1 Tax=Arthrobacter sp. TB 23 TaxID=494419 RepID=UPI0003816EDB|nr:ABC transporter permease [Arthrobacter sp. TB 23]
MTLSVSESKTPVRKSHRTKTQLRRGATTVIVLVVLWEVAVRIGLVDSFLVPPPTTVFTQLFTLAGPEALPAYALWMHIGWSLLRLILGVALGAAIGLPIGIAMGSNRFIKLTFRPILTFLLAIPSLALAPILILLMGLSEWVPVTVIAIEAAVVMAYNAELGTSSVPRNMKWAMASLGAGRFTIFTRVVLPSSLPFLITALKLSVGYGWRALIAVELLAATSFGLGFMIFQAQNYMDTKTIFAGIVAISIVGYIFERVVFGRLERTVNAWYAISTKER